MAGGGRRRTRQPGEAIQAYVRTKSGGGVDVNARGGKKHGVRANGVRWQAHSLSHSAALARSLSLSHSSAPRLSASLAQLCSLGFFGARFFHGCDRVCASRAPRPAGPHTGAGRGPARRAWALGGRRAAEQRKTRPSHKKHFPAGAGRRKRHGPRPGRAKPSKGRQTNGCAVAAPPWRAKAKGVGPPTSLAVSTASPEAPAQYLSQQHTLDAPTAKKHTECRTK